MLHMHSQQRLGLAAAYFMSQQGAGERVGGAQGADICECKYLWGEKLGKKKNLQGFCGSFAGHWFLQR